MAYGIDELGRMNTLEPQPQTRPWWVVNDAHDLLAVLLLGFAFFLPISLSVAQPFAYLAVPVWVVLVAKGAEKPLRNPLFWPMLIFVVLLLLGSLFGPRPMFSIMRSRRILLMSLVFMMGAVFQLQSSDARRSLWTPLLLFMFGSTLLGLSEWVRIPLQLRAGQALYDLGNMRDPQLYLVSTFVLLALWFYRPVRVPAVWLAVLTLINVAGMVLHFKRGVWISFALTAVLAAAMTRRYHMLLVLLLGMLALCFVPQAQDRLQLLRQELEEGTGGRRVLWTRVAPNLIKDNPMGAGFRGLDHADFVESSPIYLQPGLNHLHNNLLQVAVDAGWLGAAVWTYWMGLTLFIMIRLVRSRHAADPRHKALALACTASFVALMLNGMVEYNFGNSVVFMVMMLLMGTAVALQRADRAMPEEPPS